MNALSSIKLLDETAVIDLLPTIDVVQTMRQLFRALGEDRAVQPPQTLSLLGDARGDFITYPGVLTERSVFGVKLSPYIVTDDRPIVTAWTLLMSSKTGAPLALVDASRLTTERTGATSALAIDYLARPDACRLAIIGSGDVAWAHFRHAYPLRSWREVRLFSPSLAESVDGKGRWLDQPVEITRSAEDCVRNADVVILATSSAKPVIDAVWLGGDTLVTSISTNAVQAHEVSPAFLNEAQVYCDDRRTTPGSAGEMQLASSQHGWDKASIRGDLAGLATGTCPLPVPGRPIFFRSIGLGLEDIAIVEAILSAHSANGPASYCSHERVAS
ncbi:ornithine cyclodeaminase family protein [Rhizobium ruizarguesonis]|uniref:ornithine cyclodeaminase family protein n=1 Tax=Rhizobium ruizarguesonis TaxID=2081791 RepID=UPI001030D3C0|nr:ornithine cyclodeaminase family protein [Rhizobium ruizarguesonis]TBA08212.1 ornithine cyclodeaminase family protein [Rhizobium ruizarguesonis]